MYRQKLMEGKATGILISTLLLPCCKEYGNRGNMEQLKVVSYNWGKMKLSIKN